MARLIPKVNQLPSEYVKNPISNTFYLFPITSSEVETQISNFKKPGKSAGPYSLPVNILEIIRNVVSVPLASLVNTSISRRRLTRVNRPLWLGRFVFPF